VIALAGLDAGCASDSDGDNPPETEECLLDARAVPEYQATWTEAVAAARAASCENVFRLSLGKCGDEILFVSRSLGFSAVGFFYDSTSGNFLSLTSGTDVANAPCDGTHGWWPSSLSLDCELTVTEELCAPPA
jgi:hypothetical protein